MHRIFITLAVLAVFFILGTGGGLETGDLTFEQYIIRTVIGIVVFAVSVIMVKVHKKSRTHKR